MTAARLTGGRLGPEGIQALARSCAGDDPCVPAAKLVDFNFRDLRHTARADGKGAGPSSWDCKHLGGTIIDRIRSKSINKHAPVAQLDRATDYESVGREFESLRAHH